MATANFTFTTLTGSETAGWQSINALITSIDTQLYSKASGIAAGGTIVGQLLRWNGTSWVAGTVSASSIDNNAVELGTKTTGNYVATLAGQAGETDVSGSGSESAAVSVRLANNTALRGAATVESAPDFDPGYTADNKVVDTDFVLDALSYATTGGVTLSGDVTGATNANTISNGAVTEAKIASNAVTNAKLADNAVNTSEIANGAVTYAKLDNSVKAYSVSTGASVGSYYTSNGSFAPDSVSTGAATVYLVISDPAANAGTITLTLDDAYLGPYAVTGQSITILQKTAGTTNIVAASGTAGTNDWIEVTGLQLEVGSAPSEFEFESYETTLRKCQRYYEQVRTSNTRQIVFSSIDNYFAGNTTSFCVTKRAIPNMSIWDINNNINQIHMQYAGSSGGSNTTYTTITRTLNGFHIEKSLAGVGDKAGAFIFSWAADAEL